MRHGKPPLTGDVIPSDPANKVVRPIPDIIFAEDIPEIFVAA